MTWKQLLACGVNAYIGLNSVLRLGACRIVLSSDFNACTNRTKLPLYCVYTMRTR